MACDKVVDTVSTVANSIELIEASYLAIAGDDVSTKFSNNENSNLKATIGAKLNAALIARQAGGSIND